VAVAPAGSPDAVFAATGVAFLFTLGWLAVQLASAVRFAKAPSGDVDRLAVIAWGLSFAGGFTGPCVILLSLVALGIGAAALRKAPEPGSRSRIAAQAAVIASAVILVMTLLMVLVLLVGGLL